MLILLCAAACLAEACGTGPACVNGDCAYGDGAHFCQCRRGWAGAACDAPRAGFRRVTTNTGKASTDRAVNYACLVNGTECTESNKCTYYAGAYSCDPCPAGFVSYEDECLPRGCFNTGDLSGQEATKAPCNGRGRCLLKDPGLAGLSADDYACDCYPIYRGGLCQSCDDANAIAVESSSSDALPTCNARACQDSDGIVCSGQGTCTLDVGLDRESYRYRCKCNDGYTRVGHRCVKTECVATIDGSPVVCGGFGKCIEEGDGAPKCACDPDAVQVDKFCTSPTCTTETPAKICGGVGACVRDGAGYSCDCRGLATGNLCENCVPEKSESIDGTCVPVGCLTSNKQSSCTNKGVCVKSDGEYHCRCPDMLIAVDGECTSPACMDEELGKVCSGHGTCKTDDPRDIKCTCEADYTYVAPGRCILSTLVDSPATVCSDHGRIVVSAEAPDTMTCQCSPIYTGAKCAECDQQNAQVIGEKCIAKKCIVQQQPPDPQPSLRTATAQDICGNTGTYTTYGDPSNPFITCVPKDADSGNVSAYNGTFSAKPGCVFISKIDKTRRFFCGFLENITENLSTGNLPTCAKPSEKPDLPETCTHCPTDFHLVHFGENNSTCMHKSCHDGKSSHMWYNYCGGVGDCIQKKDKSGYECDCGTAAKWDPNLKACVTDACKLNKSLAGPYAPDYCIPQSTFTLECTVGRDATWQCNCTGDYVTYNKTCISKSKNADPKTQRARGLCGGPGAGYIDSTGTCVCSNGFLKIGDMCYSYDCLPVGISDNIRNPDINVLVCSGKGVCAYNQLTGRYGCECSDGLEAFGGYCTHPGCAGKVMHNGEIKYVECKIYDGTTGDCTNDKGTYSCKCTTPYRSVNGICVHQRCVSYDNVYCGGDVLAACVQGSNYYYGCVCSEGYERGQLNSECIPSKCVYRRLLSDPTIACNGLGTCGGEGSLLKNRRCECKSGAKLVTLRDVNGELRETCILSECISSEDGVEPPIICGGLGSCGPTGCVCDLGTKLFKRACFGINCFINTVDDSGQLVESVCGGETVGVCTKIASHGDRRDYACKCKDPKPDEYEELDGFCLPKACIFEITTLTNQQVRTMCGGKQFGTCVLNATQSSKSYCKCINRYDIIQITNGKCMKKTCLSDSLSGGPEGYVECSGHGKCIGDHIVGYSCNCDENYQTVADDRRYLCVPAVCVVSETNSSTICNGRGTCQFKTDPGKCECRPGYDGTKCETCANGYKEHTDAQCYLNGCPADNCGTEENTSVGACQFSGNSFACVCVNSSFVVDSASKKCRKSRCVWSDPYDQTEKTCYGMGTCNDNGEDTGACVCNPGTTLVGTNICVYSQCISDGSDPKAICKGRGTCVEGPVAGTGLCRCNSSRYRTDKKTGQCFVKECFGAHESILAEVCDGGGTCSEDTKKCNCSVDGFQSLDGQNGCVHSSCVSSNNKLCSGFGACEKTGDTYGCLCASYYTLVDKDCIPTRCLKDGKVCNGGGTCSGEGSSATCSCNQGWASLNNLCYPAACVSSGTLCGGNGNCPLSTDSTCECKYGYESVLDQLCISSQCVQRGTDGTVTICGGNGKCVSENGVTPSCVCNEGFSLTSDFVCGVPAPSNKSSSTITIAVVVVVLLVLVAVAGFLVWWFVIRPRKSGELRERAPRKGPSFSGSQKLKKQASSKASLHATAPLLSRSSHAGSSVQL
ncbi:High cysteine membrane protein EGF-like [Giardia duodenalis]|uniref:High cysteine membrane protein EGF-like n=1 Tax=Giardia intestinalis (strain ATCC 50803 / WB clone C6) TaxID=184922 RepID=A8BWG3_GIAIC|nr:High cysteine membrane protein EGF-like [Giardia intestinalis]KAE8306013.1 High cysteine membrane protein EGF-like [Giardia intestinalis]|eukprot:XP_001704496.1 High cysteine membrane protein EGF-like [Giardia lamblia ATCC 50803]